MTSLHCNQWSTTEGINISFIPASHPLTLFPLLPGGVFCPRCWLLRVNAPPDMPCYSPWQLCKSFCYCLPSIALLIKLLLQAIVLLLKSSMLSIWPPISQKWLCQGYQRTSSVPHHTVSVDPNEMYSEKQLRWVWSGGDYQGCTSTHIIFLHHVTIKLWTIH